MLWLLLTQPFLVILNVANSSINVNKTMFSILLLLSRICLSLSEYIPCVTKDDCEEEIKYLELREDFVNFNNLLCLLHKDEGKKYCVEKTSGRHYDWIVLSDCADSSECQINYPDSPICDTQTGLCSGIPDNLKPPKNFNHGDLCKKMYGDDFVYDKKSNSCRVPKCDVSNDFCPKPSKCWRGSCYVFETVNVTITHCTGPDSCQQSNTLCSHVSSISQIMK